MRTVKVKLLLEGGHVQELELVANAPELIRLFQILSQPSERNGAYPGELIQLPLQNGTEAFSFHSTQLVAASTTPPVLIQTDKVEQTPQGEAAPAQIDRPTVAVIDDFLAPHEHSDMLAFAVQNRESFDAGTVITGPQNARQDMAFLDFAEHPHSRLVTNRLLTWLPFLLSKLKVAAFPVHQVESQLTASNDGHFYRAHVDRDSETQLERVLTCVYYFARQPAQFSGGELRVYDALSAGPGKQPKHQAETFQELAPVANRMVVFPSDSFHELRPVRCPSRRFEDSRFAITNWIWSHPGADQDRPHGWGHLKCGRVAPGLAAISASE